MARVDTDPGSAYEEGFARGYAVGYHEGYADAQMTEQWHGKVTNE